MKYILLIIIFLSGIKFSFAQTKINEDNYIDVTNQNKSIELNSEKINKQKNVSNKTSVQLKSSKVKKKEVLDKKVSSVKIGELNSPSLGSLGIKTNLNDKFGVNLWNDFTAAEAIKSLNYIPDVVSSKHLQTYLVELYSSASIPPSGSPNQIVKFVETKLLKLSSSGASDELEQIVTQLPNGKRWHRWKKWLVEKNLMKKNDKEACNYVSEMLKSNTEPYWRKANLICLLINENFDEANLIHDVMVSEDLIDPLFKELFINILDQNNIETIENNTVKLTPFHVIMLDMLKFPISANMIAEFDSEYTEALIELVYINSEARSFLLDKLIGFKRIDRKQMIKIYQAVVYEKPEPEKSLAALDQNANGLNRAHVWLASIGLNDDVEKVNYILDVLEIENKLGRLNQTLDLYLPSLISIQGKALPNSLNQKIKYLQILHKPKTFYENEIAKMLLVSKGSSWNLKFISENNSWGLVPYLESSGMKSPDVNWTDFMERFDFNNNKTDSFSIWSSPINYKSFLINRAIQEKSKNDQKVKTILLIARLINDRKLKNLELTNLQNIEKSLSEIGLGKLGSDLRLEVLSSKLASLVFLK